MSANTFNNQILRGNTLDLRALVAAREAARRRIAPDVTRVEYVERPKVANPKSKRNWLSFMSALSIPASLKKTSMRDDRLALKSFSFADDEDSAVFGAIKETALKNPTKKRYALLRGAFSTIVYLLIIAACVWGLPNFLSYQLGTEFPIAAITSGSMWPELTRGDLVVIRGVASVGELAVGDIIVWKTDASFVIHRIASISGDKIVTKGDANFKNDESIKFSNVVGKAIEMGEAPFHIPFLGFMSIIGGKLNAMIN